MAEEVIGPNFEIRRKNFQGSLPLQIVIDDSDLYTDKEIPTYYVMQPRMSYLFLLTPQLHEFYSEYLEIHGVTKDDYWYSYKQHPLRFDIPIGVLYDTLVQQETGKNNLPNRPSTLPFKITLHYNNFPTKKLQKGMAKHIFPQALKESSMIRTGKATPVQDKLENTKSMLNAIKEAKYDDFWRYNEELGEHKLEELKFFPVRVTILDKPEKDASSVNWINLKVLQRPIKVNNKDMCIGEYLARVLPKYFHIQSEVTVDEDAEGEAEGEDTKKQSEEVETVQVAHPGTEVIVNGLNIELDMSLMWLIMNLPALDNFLYVIVRIPAEASA